MSMLESPVQLGSPERTVEIDENKFMHRKQQRGRFRPGQWVLGMVERETNLTMIVPAETRDTGTLLPIIAQYVRPGTRIMIDNWRAYNALRNHTVVNHQYNFIAPNNLSIHKDRVEGSWSLCKVKVRSMEGTSNANFNINLQEFLWWQRIKDNYLVKSFIRYVFYNV